MLMLPDGAAKIALHACMNNAPSISNMVGEAGMWEGRTAVVASTRPACKPDEMTKLMLQEFPQ